MERSKWRCWQMGMGSLSQHKVQLCSYIDHFTEPRDCCLGWKWQRAAVQVLSASWPGDEGLSSHLCYRESLMELWWSGRSKVCSAFRVENVMKDEAGGGGHLVQQLWWSHKATQMYLERALTPHSARNLHKQENQVCCQESPHSGSKQERNPGMFWENSNLISHLVRSGMF